MNLPLVVDRTSSGKEHFEVLDGLRGSAAFLIVIFHLFNYSFGFRGPWALIKHAYLAVDYKNVATRGDLQPNRNVLVHH